MSATKIGFMRTNTRSRLSKASYGHRLCEMQCASGSGLFQANSDDHRSYYPPTSVMAMMMIGHIIKIEVLNALVSQHLKLL